MPKKHSLFKNKTQMIIYLILFVVFLGGFIYFGSKDYTKTEDSHEKFSMNYPLVSEDNVYEYINASSALTLVKSNNVIILFGINSSKWFEYYANIVNEVAKEENIEKIYYYNITNDRYNNNATYEAIVEYLSSYISFLDDDTHDLYAPTLLVKKDGKIIFFDDDTAIRKGDNTSESYWTNYAINAKKDALYEVFDLYKGIK